MPGVRPLVKEDIPQLLPLNARLFPGSSSLSEEEQRWRFNEVCFQNPWYDPKIPSLVVEGEDGKLIGFVAIVPRRMKLKDRIITMVVSQHLMVDPASRSTFAAIDLLKAALTGPQDVTLADMSTDLSRKIWERLGGTTSFLYSIHWRKPLRPVSFVASFAQSKALRMATTIAKPLISAGDSLAHSVLGSSEKINTTTEDLSASDLISLMNDFYRGDFLLPSYENGDLEWLFNFQRREKRFGTFQSMKVKNANGKVIGWFVYHLQPRGTCNVLQVGARDMTIEVVLDSLFEHARKAGAVELTGRMEPRFMKAFGQKRCIILPGRSWVLTASKDPEVLRYFDQGKVFLSRLEGDPWLL